MRDIYSTHRGSLIDRPQSAGNSCPPPQALGASPAQNNFADYVRSNPTSGDAGTLTFRWLSLYADAKKP
jgi:hypothetical protein